MVDQKTISIYDEKVGEYADRFARDVPSEPLKKFMNLLPKGARILDWGCGPAASSFHMRNFGFVPDPLDASLEMVNLANERFNIGARVGTFDDELLEAAYDGVWANFSLLHARREDLPRHIARLNKALKISGLLYMGMKTGEGERRDHLGRFYTYYQISELRTFLEMRGFKLLDLVEGQEAGLAGKIEPFALIMAQKL